MLQGPNQYIRMITKGSSDTEDFSFDIHFKRFV